MKKYAVLFVSLLFFVFQLHAMERVWETDEQFVERTKDYKQEGDVIFKREILYSYNDYSDSISYPVGILRAFSPDKRKKIELVQFDKSENKEKSKFFVENNENKKYQGDLDLSLYQKVALSPCGNIIATVRHEVEWLEPSDSYYIATAIELHNILTQKKKDLFWDHDYYPESIAFNKQGTKLIVHWNHEGKYRIFLLEETEEEFIKRTKRSDDQHFMINASKSESLEYCNILSFDKTKRAIITFERDKRGHYAQLTVFDVRGEKKFKKFNFILDKYYALTSLDFNKQGTLLLVRGLWEDNKGKCKKRMMIPIE